MDQQRKVFEAELKAKLSQKANATQREEAVLVRNFRYFDADSDGSINFMEWCRAIEKAGVSIPSKEEYKQLFNYYDLNKDGLINCKEFGQILYSNQPPTHFPIKIL